MSRGRVCVWILLWLQMSIGRAETPAVGPAAAAMERGRRIFETGVGGGEPIEAVLNEGQLVLSATTLTCTGCHGRDGRGSTEGGVTVPDIRWSALTRPLAASGPTQRSRPVYDADRLRRAIAMGWDAGGNELHRAMPRFRMSSVDADDLITYLQGLDHREPPGVSADAVKIATLSPPITQSARLARYEQTLRATWDRINRQGGLFGRRLEFVVVQAGETTEVTAELLRQMITREQPLALVAPFFAGAEAELTAITEQAGIPVVAPLAYAPARAEAMAQHVYWVLPGQQHALEVLAQQAGTLAEESGGRVAFVRAAHPRARRDALQDDEIAQLVDRVVGERTKASVVAFRYAGGAHDAPAVAANAQQLGIKAVMLLGDQLETEALLAAFATSGKGVSIFVLSTSAAVRLVGTAARLVNHPAAIYVAFPAVGADLERGSLGGALEQTAQLGAELLVEALKRAGASVDRARLSTALESLSEYQVGDYEPVAFGPGRRTGVRGAVVLRLGNRVEGAPIASWISLDR